MSPDISTRPHRPRKFKIAEISDIISTFKRLTTVQNVPIGEACAQIAGDYGRTKDVIYALVRRFVPSVDAADAYLKSNALRLAMRVVRKADVDQAIDVLSRSNIGVLAPKQEAGGNAGGFFLSVTADTCGAVKVTAGMVQQPPERYADLPHPMDIDQGRVLSEDGSETPPSPPLRGRTRATTDVLEVDNAVTEEAAEPLNAPGVPHPYQGRIGRFSRPKEEWGKRHQIELDRAKQKLKEARRQASADQYKDVDV